MCSCNLPYIPKYLHKEGRHVIDTFEIGVFLYRRCKPEELNNPFRTISITELSHNLSHNEGKFLSGPFDVLYSIRNDENFEIYRGLEICCLEIKSLTANGGYKKEYFQVKNNIEYRCVIELIHEPVSCMYPHCVFRVWVNGEIVNYNNYSQTIGRLQRIRNSLKEELASMIIQRQLSQDGNKIE